MPVIRYHDVSDVPPAILCDTDMSPEEGLRLACELSSVALRLAASSEPTERVQKMRSTAASVRPPAG